MKRIITGILSIAPSILIVMALVLSLLILPFSDVPMPENLHISVAIFLPTIAASSITLFVLMVVYMIHSASKNFYLFGSEKIKWIVFLYFFSIITVPIYWYHYIFIPSEPDRNEDGTVMKKRLGKTPFIVAVATISLLILLTFVYREQIAKTIFKTDLHNQISQEFTTNDGNVAFNFSSGWKANEENEVYDMEVTNERMAAFTGVFVYNGQDIESDYISPSQVIIDGQIEQLKELREDFEFSDESEEYVVNGNSYLTVVYTGTRDGSTFVYRFTVIDFDDSDIFAHIVQTSYESDYYKLKTAFKEITDSAKLI